MGICFIIRNFRKEFSWQFLIIKEIFQNNFLLQDLQDGILVLIEI